MNITFLRQLFVVNSSILVAISTGATMGLPSILVQQLKSNSSLIHVDPDTESWIASVHGFAGAPSVVVPCMMQRWGRRVAFRVSALSVLIGWGMLYVANNALTILIAEIFQGAGLKSFVIVCLMATSEMVDPKIRNPSIVSYGVTQTFLVMFVHTSGSFIHWQTISLVMCIPLTLAIICSFIWPESPAWLAYKGRFEESKKAFVWLRSTNKESLVEMNALFSAQREFLHAKMSAKASKLSKPLMRSVWRKITSRDFYLPIFHMFVLLTSYYWSGNLLIVVYAINIIGKVVENTDSAFVGVVVIDVAFIVGSIGSPILLKYFGNKTVLLTGGLFSILFLLCSSAVLYLQELGVISENSTLCLFFLVGFMIFSSAAFYIIPFGMSSEIIPLRHRGVAGCLYIIFMSVSYTCSLKIAPFLITHLGMYGIFLFYVVILIFCLIWIWQYVPETKNKTLQSIEEHFIRNNEDADAIDEDINENTSINLYIEN